MQEAVQRDYHAREVGRYAVDDDVGRIERRIAEGRDGDRRGVVERRYAAGVGRTEAQAKDGDTDQNVAKVHVKCPNVEVCSGMQS